MIRKTGRTDDIPLVLYLLIRMKTDEITDSIFIARTDRDGLTYGRLSVLFVTYAVHPPDRRLSGTEERVPGHKTVAGRVPGRKVDDREAAAGREDRLKFPEKRRKKFRVRTGQHIVSACELPADTGRYDTAGSGVCRRSGGSKCMVRSGRGRDRRPDLLLYGQGPGTAGPSGIPPMRDAVSGEKADGGYCVPARRRTARTAGRSGYGR